MNGKVTNSEQNHLKEEVRALEKLLWQLPRKIVIDLLLEQRDKLTDADADTLDRHVSELIATKEDRMRDWLEENAQSLEEYAQCHQKKSV